MSALAVVPAQPAPPARTLFDIEEHLAALVDSAELVAAEQSQEFLADLETAMLAAKDKRDRVGAFLVQCEGQAAICKAEIERLRKRQALFLACIDRMEGYVLRVILQQPLDAKGRPPKLVGNTSSFGAQRNPPSVIVTDEAAVPSSCKTVTVTMPAVMWESVCDSLDMDFGRQVLDAIKRPVVAIGKALVKDAIAAAVPDWKKQLDDGKPSVYCEDVGGAAIAAGDWRLTRS